LKQKCSPPSETTNLVNHNISHHDIPEEQHLLYLGATTQATPFCESLVGGDEGEVQSDVGCGQATLFGWKLVPLWCYTEIHREVRNLTLITGPFATTSPVFSPEIRGTNLVTASPLLLGKAQQLLKLSCRSVDIGIVLSAFTTRANGLLSLKVHYRWTVRVHRLSVWNRGQLRAT